MYTFAKWSNRVWNQTFNSCSFCSFCWARDRTNVRSWELCSTIPRISLKVSCIRRAKLSSCFFKFTIHHSFLDNTIWQKFSCSARDLQASYLLNQTRHKRQVYLQLQVCQISPHHQLQFHPQMLWTQPQFLHSDHWLQSAVAECLHTLWEAQQPVKSSRQITQVRFHATKMDTNPIKAMIRKKKPDRSLKPNACIHWMNPILTSRCQTWICRSEISSCWPLSSLSFFRNSACTSQLLHYWWWKKGSKLDLQFTWRDC